MLCLTQQAHPGMRRHERMGCREISVTIHGCCDPTISLPPIKLTRHNPPPPTLNSRLSFNDSTQSLHISQTFRQPQHPRKLHNGRRRRTRQDSRRVSNPSRNLVGFRRRERRPCQPRLVDRSSNIAVLARIVTDVILGEQVHWLVGQLRWS